MFKKNPAILCEELEQEVMVFHAGKDEFYNFEGIGSIIWSHIESMPLHEIQKHILQEYDISPEDLESDMDGFIQELIQNNLIIEEK